MALRKVVLELDEEDYDELQREIAFRQRLDHSLHGHCQVESGSSMVGFYVAEMIRDLDQFRSAYSDAMIDDEGSDEEDMC